jgi:hypothetical protein
MIVAALAVSSVAGAVALVRGPYLQAGGGAAVVVRWRTDVATDSRVRWGYAPGLVAFDERSSLSTTEHEVTLRSLPAGRRIYYAVGSSASTLAGFDADTWYDVPPAADASQPFRAWVLGDPGSPTQAQLRVRDAYAAFSADRPTGVWILLGDNAYESGTDAEYQTDLFDPYTDFLRTHVLWATRGNHDDLHSGANNDYYDLFDFPTSAEAGGVPSGTEAWYSFDYADAHFVCLDSEGAAPTPGGPMLTWLAADLAATDRRWIIAFFHRPPYSKGSHDSDTDPRMTQMREDVLPVLEQHGVDLVLAGHSHVYERSFLLDSHYGPSTTLEPWMVKDGGDGRAAGDGPYQKPRVRTPHAGAVYVVCGVSASVSSGSLDHPVMVEGLATFGSVVLDVTANRLDGRFLDDHGVVRDDFRIEKFALVNTGGPLGDASLALLNAGPQPARGSVTFEYRLPAAGRASLELYDVRGHRVKQLFAESRPAGVDVATWDRRDDAGRRAPPGVYFANLAFAGERRVARVVLLD